MRTSWAWMLNRFQPAASSARSRSASRRQADGLDGVDPERLDDRLPAVHGGEHTRGAGRGAVAPWFAAGKGRSRCPRHRLQSVLGHTTCPNGPRVARSCKAPRTTFWRAPAPRYPPPHGSLGRHPSPRDYRRDPARRDRRARGAVARGQRPADRLRRGRLPSRWPAVCDRAPGGRPGRRSSATTTGASTRRSRRSSRASSSRRCHRRPRSPTARRPRRPPTTLPEPHLTAARTTQAVFGARDRGAARLRVARRRAVPGGPHVDDQVLEPGDARGGAGVPVLLAVVLATRAWRPGRHAGPPAARGSWRRPSRSAWPAPASTCTASPASAIVVDWLWRTRASTRAGGWTRGRGDRPVGCCRSPGGSPWASSRSSRRSVPRGRTRSAGSRSRSRYHGGYAAASRGPGHGLAVLAAARLADGLRAAVAGRGHVPRRRRTC